MQAAAVEFVIARGNDYIGVSRSDNRTEERAWRWTC
jgi:hypothetical protein